MLEKLLEKCNDAPSREMAIRHTIIRLLEQREAKDARIKELEDKLKLAVEAISAGMPFMEKWLASCDGSTPHEDATHLMRQALASLRDGEGKETGK
jgi:hypothetical protein